MGGVTADQSIALAVIAARLLLPLLIPKYPLPGVLACFFADAMDQSALQSFTRLDLSAYQNYDKALDVYYLSIAMLAMLRNWTNQSAVQVGRFLFYFRMVGVLAFESIGWRPLLLIFPNTFEFYFIFYEAVHAWGSPERVSMRKWLWAAASIWVLIKIPHELWLHVARLDMTELIRARILGGRFGEAAGEVIAHLILAAVAVAIAAMTIFAVRRLAPPPRHRMRVATAPLPPWIDGRRDQTGHSASEWRLFDLRMVEKIALVGLFTMIMAAMLPNAHLPPLQLIAGVAVIIATNSLLRLWWARLERPLPTPVAAFVALGSVNLGLVLVADRLLRSTDEVLPLPLALFFPILPTLIVTLYDAWRPLYDIRFARPPG